MGCKRAENDSDAINGQGAWGKEQSKCGELENWRLGEIVISDEGEGNRETTNDSPKGEVTDDTRDGK